MNNDQKCIICVDWGALNLFLINFSVGVLTIEVAFGVTIMLTNHVNDGM